MPPGVIFRVGGALDPSYKAALAQSVAEAKSAQIQMNRGMVLGDSTNTAVAISSARARKEVDVLRTQQRDLKTLQSAMIAQSALASSDKVKVADEIAKKEEQIQVIYAQDAALKVARIRKDAGLAISAEQIAMLKASEAEQTAIFSAAAAERVTIARAEAMSEVEARIAAGGTGTGGRGRHGGGLSNIIREITVIFREGSMGRTSRIPGSLTLLAQYFGVLNIAMKSTATSAVKNAAAMEKLSMQMDVEAVRAKGTAAETELLAAAQTQAAITADAQKVATQELAVAQVTLNPIFFATAGLIAAAGIAAFFLWRHFTYLARSAKNVADSLNPLKKSFTELAKAEDAAAKSAQENADYLDELLGKHNSESDALERKIKLLREESEARGLSNRATLEAEQQLLLTEQARLKTALDKAVVDEKAASTADISGAKYTDEQGRAIDLRQAKNETDLLGKYADAAQLSADHSLQQQIIDSFAGKNGDAKIPMWGGFFRDFVGMDKIGKEYGTTVNQAIQALNKSIGLTKFNAGTSKKPYLITVDTAQANYQKAKAIQNKLQTDQTALDDVLKNKKSSLADIHSAYAKVQADLQDVGDELAHPVKESRRGEQRSATERERIGVGAPQVANLQKQTLDVSRMQLTEARKLNSKIDKMISSGDGNRNPDGW